MDKKLWTANIEEESESWEHPEKYLIKVSVTHFDFPDIVIWDGEEEVNDIPARIMLAHHVAKVLNENPSDPGLERQNRIDELEIRIEEQQRELNILLGKPRTEAIDDDDIPF